MTARSGAPPGKRTGPVGDRAGGVEALGGGYDATILAHTTVTAAEPRCALCPLCRRHTDCRGWRRG